MPVSQGRDLEAVAPTPDLSFFRSANAWAGEWTPFFPIHFDIGRGGRHSTLGALNMSHLVRIVREELSAIHSETNVAIWLSEEAVEASNKTKEDWDHLWTDVGGEG